MKSTAPHFAICICFLMMLPGCGSAPAAAPVPQSPASTAGPITNPDPPPAAPPKPPADSQINPANALSAGLVSLVALNEGSGNAFYDAATRQTYHAVKLSGTPAGALPPTWFTPPVSADYPWKGPAIQNNHGSTLAIESNLLPLRFIGIPTLGYSYAVLLQPLDTTTFGRIFDATGAAVITAYLNIPGGQGTVSTTWRNLAGGAVNPKYRFVQNKWMLVLFTVQQGMGVMYVNGVEVAQDTTVNLLSSIANQTGGLVYNATGDGGNIPNANFSSWWVWNNRVLTAKEAAEFYANPWAMLK